VARENLVADKQISNQESHGTENLIIHKLSAKVCVALAARIAILRKEKYLFLLSRKGMKEEMNEKDPPRKS
jgi:hypothetical protein